jgi:hypothetical protein
MTRHALAAGLAETHRRLGAVVLDVSWKVLWLVGTGSLLAVLSLWVCRQLATIEVSAPPAAFRNPLALMILVRQLWQAYAGSVGAMLTALLAASCALWIVLESYFRAGIFAAGPPSFFQRTAKSFRRFLFMSCLKVLVIGNSAMILAIIVFRHYLRTPPADWHLLWIDSRGTFFASLIILVALWLALTMIEVLARRDALDLIGPHLLVLAGMFTALWLFELIIILAFVVGCAVLASLLPVSAAPVFVVACAASVTLLTVVHSYLVTARFAFIDVLHTKQNEERG